MESQAQSESTLQSVDMCDSCNAVSSEFITKSEQMFQAIIGLTNKVEGLLVKIDELSRDVDAVKLDLQGLHTTVENLNSRQELMPMRMHNIAASHFFHTPLRGPNGFLQPPFPTTFSKLMKMEELFNMYRCILEECAAGTQFGLC
ncbi:hypothetical protein BDQ12DRAFT_737848 [Crucibulum laeve]|uniref:Uncharacterized protein n=1 Tax=Crucibulum laeve TaxID=68775 RepID=A0A5C3LQW6_9AGAR|nr:hypothetical protein BDQ12DRAFT_737848 [Crucibulum laeve]